MKLNQYTMICPGDLVVVDFGTSSIRSRVMGRHPAYVVSLDDARRMSAQMLVIPAFRKPSLVHTDDDIRLDTARCPGLRHEMYVQVLNLQRVGRMDVMEKIGHVNDDRVMDEVREHIMNWIGGRDEHERKNED